MAHIIPTDITRQALAGGHQPELETLRRLRSALSEDYTVFHGVHWAREYRHWTHFGEIDFVILNRSGDLLFIEQKNGLLEEGADGLHKPYEDGSSNPVEQVHRSINKVREKFRLQHGSGRRPDIGYLVYLPDHRVRDINAVGLDASRVVDARSRDQLAVRIGELLGPGTNADEEWYARVHAFFCQSFRVVPDIATHREVQQRAFVRQVGPVADLLECLEMEPFRLRIVGAAGSGKSLVAQQFFERQARQGRRVLLTCFNRPLARHFRRIVPAGGYVDTFHGLCVETLKSGGARIDFREPGIWDRIPSMVIDAGVPEAWQFDTLIVDEGQDFEPEWCEILSLFLRSNRPDLLWLEDPEQNLSGRPPVPLDEVVVYRCRTNYRCPDSIARFIRSTLPFEFEPGNDLPGLGVGVHPWEDSSTQSRVVARILRDLLGRGFTHEDIVILSMRGIGQGALDAEDAVGGLRLHRPTTEYDAQGDQVYTDGQLAVETVRRFKGQSAPAVIIIDIDPRPDRLEQDLRLLYCGMTRATVRLDLVVRTDNPENARFLQ